VIDLAGRADTGAFLARLVRLDPAAVVRLRPVGVEAVELWAMLPFDVLATRRIATRLDRDVTVAAADLLAAVDRSGRHVADSGVKSAPSDQVAVPRRDAAWRWPLPPSRGTAVEIIPAAELVRVAAAASRTLRQAVHEGVGGRAVGERVLRDALLDHVAITVTGTGGERLDVPQRVVQAVVRMGFLRAPDKAIEPITSGDEMVTLRLAAGWTGVDASYGSVWYRPTSPLRFR
jgi:hypothetical protein